MVYINSQYPIMYQETCGAHGITYPLAPLILSPETNMALVYALVHNALSWHPMWTWSLGQNRYRICVTWNADWSYVKNGNGNVVHHAL